MGAILETNDDLLALEERRESFNILDLKRKYPSEIDLTRKDKVSNLNHHIDGANGCPYATNGTCHAGSITKDDYACGSGCGLCAPLAVGCTRPCGSWTLKLRGTGGKFIRENVMLALLEQRAVSQSEGETLGHGPTMARLLHAKSIGATRVVVLRDPISRIISRYWCVRMYHSNFIKTDTY